MKCAWCKGKATHYASLVYDHRGETKHLDDYLCDTHADMVEKAAEQDPTTIEFEAKELPK